MKQILLAVVAGTAAFGASATDGTFSGSNVIGGVRYYVYECDGTKLAKANGAVQFVYNGAVVGAGVYGFLADGTFSAGTIRIPDQAGNTVAITVDVWDKTTGATFDSATYTWSSTVTITLGGAGSPAAPPAPLTGFNGQSECPEPSTIALAALGLGSLCFIAHRK